VRILLIAPNSPDINTVPEIRTITSRHHTTVLNGAVTPQTIDQYARQGYAAFHFAGHSSPDHVELSCGTTLEADDIVRFARMAGAKMLFFNSCEAGRLAAYAVAHGMEYVIACTIKLDDDVAWEFPSAFYNSLANGAWRDILAAYRAADSGNGEYTLAVAPAFLGDMSDQINELKAKVKGTVSVSATMMRLMVGTTALSLIIILIMLMVHVFLEV